ncbi:MAG: hypothetical protein DKM50_12765 [Candidatus Margulisiibacteriota bacterium]|nr:MAG: hypothetical protein DKM50_12765 [Candidatus Margulisiibacteriota bacterium]HCY37541.1 hypothetical protein [Candidatus Margulisiibacteriota bacterium]
MKVIIPDYLKNIIARFIDQGFDIYLVGGSLRDIILGCEVQDFDLATNALPDTVSGLFSKTVNVGKNYGTIIVVSQGHNIEVTTLRKESGYTDARHPETVIFCNDIFEDLSRRDFTMNAIAYDFKTGRIIDPFNGQEAIREHVITCVGNPKERLKEDTLRIFRAARFSAQLGFSIERTTLAALQELSPHVQLPAAERIKTELIKLCKGANFKQGLHYLYEWGLFSRLIAADLSSFPERITNIPETFDLCQRIACFFSTLPRQEIDETLEKLRFTRKEIKTIKGLINNNFDYNLSALTVKSLDITGQEIKDLGFDGPIIGKIQQFLLAEIKSKKIENQKDILLAIIRKSYLE